jgi:peroxiredoxin
MGLRQVLATTLAAVLAAAAPAPAGEFNKVLSPGDAAPAWEGLEGTDGRKHSLADLKGKDVVVVVFTCNSCPVAVGYEDRIVAFANKHAAADSKVAVVAINVNTLKEDQLPEMRKRAEKKKFPFAYLYDPSQEIAKKYGANYTPEFFVLDRDRKVAYLGAMDDKSPPAAATASFLEDAVAAALAGKKLATGETLARGCRIRFNKKADD